MNNKKIDYKNELCNSLFKKIENEYPFLNNFNLTSKIVGMIYENPAYLIHNLNANTHLLNEYIVKSICVLYNDNDTDINIFIKNKGEYLYAKSKKIFSNSISENILCKCIGIMTELNDIECLLIYLDDKIYKSSLKDIFILLIENESHHNSEINIDLLTELNTIYNKLFLF